MPSRLKIARGVYLITPDFADTPRLLSLTERLLQNPPALLQYRNKTADTALRRQQAEALLHLCRQAGVPLIVNDDWPLAQQIGADGVHLGELDGDPAEIRKAMGDDALIGVSCYDDIARAQRLSRQDVDYLAFGAVFASGTKPQARQAPLDLFKSARALGKATVAIGGITPDNCGQVRDAGADFIAVISGVYSAPDPVAALATYHHFFKQVPK
jgi:thiamine-phosphate pyrophosphorylase